MNAPATVNIARLIFIIVCEAIGMVLAYSTIDSGGVEIPMWIGLLGGLLIAGFFIFVETLVRDFTLRGFSTATFGLLVGLLCAFLLTRIGLSDMLTAALNRDFVLDGGTVISGQDLALTISLTIRCVLYAGFGFIGAVLALRSSRDDFAFIVPYVRFRQEGTSGQPVVLDTETIMDGRITGVVRSGFLKGRLVVPRFILEQLQVISKSSESGERQRAERALAMLEDMRLQKDLPVSIEDVAGVAVDENVETRLLQASKLLGARLMTTDDQLSKIAKLSGLDVLNLHDLVAALRPAVVVGEKIRLPLVRPGRDEHQAVGYLSDGTMIVVNHAIDYIGATRDVRVISTLNTTNGMMVFADLDD